MAQKTSRRRRPPEADPRFSAAERTPARKEYVKPETRHAVIVVLLLTAAAVSLMSVFGWAGVLGNSVSAGLGTMFGWQRYTVPFYILVIGGLLLFPERYHLSAPRWIGFFLSLIAVAALFQFFLSYSEAFTRSVAGDGGGYIGYFFSQPLRSAMGPWAAGLILFGLLIVGLLVMLNTTLQSLARQSTIMTRLTAPFRSFFWRRRLAKIQAQPMDDQAAVTAETAAAEPAETEAEAVEPEEPVEQDEQEYVPLPPKPSRKQKRTIVVPLDLLDLSSSQPMSGNIEANKERIQRTLKNFGIDVEMGDVNVGPTVTQFTLKPAEGVKLAQITSLNNDLALALAAHPIRIEAPIPGKSLVGIEVPNQSVAVVNLRDVLGSEEFKTRKSDLSFSLGKDVSGKPWVADLASMPHMLVAGATGSGKSVMINGLIISMLYSNSPDDLKLILVDPKRVELSLYNNVPHLMTPVITDTTKTINALRWVVSEMDRRYHVLQNAGKRNISSYRKEVADDMPYIVVVIDELADLMTVAANEVESAIVRLSQMARAVGIHLVLATQRPSVDVITGLIKANITARIAFSVASQTDSRTILDSSGAEKLLGKGDMLFISAELSKPRRLQGAYVSEQEVERVANYLKARGTPDYMQEIVDKPSAPLGGSLEDLGEDELLNEAKTIITQAGKASASLLQRRLRVGYARAARLLDLLEEQGFIGPGDGAKPREVYGGEMSAPASATMPFTPDPRDLAVDPGPVVNDEPADPEEPEDTPDPTSTA